MRRTGRPANPAFDQNWVPWTLCWHNNNLGTLTYVCPKGSLEQVTAAYQEFWDAVEVIRVLVTRPETWEATFTVGLEGLINPRDRLALPGAAERVLWIGGDATLEVAAATDWGAKVYISFPVEPYLGALRDFTGTPGDDATIISVAELLCLLSLAAVQHPSWDGRVVLYVTDNDNVRVWLGARHARNRMARHLLRLLRYLEARGHFVVVSAYVRTYRNQLQDFLSREIQEVVDTDAPPRISSRRISGPVGGGPSTGVWTKRPRPPGSRQGRLAACGSVLLPLRPRARHCSTGKELVRSEDSGTPSPGTRGKGIRSGSHSARRHPSRSKHSRERITSWAR